MKIIIICLVASFLFCYLLAKLFASKEDRAEVPDAGDASASCCDEEDRTEAMMEVLTDAFRALRPNSLGRGSIEFFQLDAMIERLAYGREVSVETALFLLSRIKGAEAWAEKLRTGAGA